jgi:hypothetical protein
MSKSTKKGKTISLPTEDPKLKKTSSSRSGVTIVGNIKASRDVIMGDQYNDLRQQVAQITSSAVFITHAQEVQKQIASLAQQTDLLPAQIRRIELVEADIQEVIEEAKKEKPVGERINYTLISAKWTMDTLGKSVQSAVGLGTVLAGLAQIAFKLFGG